MNKFKIKKYKILLTNVNNKFKQKRCKDLNLAIRIFKISNRKWISKNKKQIIKLTNKPKMIIFNPMIPILSI